MIKSKILNGVIIGIGLLFVLFVIDVLYEETSDLGIRGLLNTRPIVISVIDLPIGIWCIRGGYKNLTSLQPINDDGKKYRLAKWNTIILSTSLISMVVFYILWDAYHLPKFFGSAAMVSAWIAMLSVVSAIVVVLRYQVFKDEK
jgi:hypothetical protein